MTLTRDQLRAARMLLHLQQDELSALSGVGIATIKRFETGNNIRASQAASLRSTLEEAGVILFSEDEPAAEPLGLGVALLPDDELPEETRSRIEAERRREAERVAADKVRREANRAEPHVRRPRGRPKKVIPAEVDPKEGEGP